VTRERSNLATLSRIYVPVSAKIEGDPMRARIRLLAIPVAVLLGCASALAQAEDKTTDLKTFDSLQIEGCFDVKLEPGAPARAVVNATADQQQRIRVEQDGKTVRVRFADRESYDVCRGGPIRVSVTASFASSDSVNFGLGGSGSLDANVPRAAKLAGSVAGSGRLALRGAAADCNFTIAGSGSADASAFACDSTARVNVSGSGSAKLAGRTNTCELKINGSGGVAADGDCNAADVVINGSGSVGLATVASLSVQINGSGNVKYHGDPTLRAISVNGSGKLIKD
jgi:cytoskeletal protein CcmA (bactofilin family)